MFRLREGFLLLFGLQLVLSGCTGSVEAPSPAPELISDDTAVLREPVDRAEPGEVLMVPVGDLNYYAGMPAGITIVVRNIGLTEVNFPNWYLRDEDNLKIYYTPCDAEGNIDEETAVWTGQTPVIDDPVYYPVVLLPENSVILQGSISFIEDLPADTKESYYLVVVELNNEAVKVSTPPFVIKICELR